MKLETPCAFDSSITAMLVWQKISGDSEIDIKSYHPDVMRVVDLFFSLIYGVGISDFTIWPIALLCVSLGD